VFGQNVDQTYAVGLAGIDTVSQQAMDPGSGQADATDYHGRDHAGHHAQTCLGQGEEGVGVRHDDVAGADQADAAAVGAPLHPHHHRYRA